MVKNIGTNLSFIYNQKLFDHAKQSTTDALKTSSKRVIQTMVQATGDVIGNEIASRITKVLRRPLQNNSETITDEHDKEIPKEKHISSEERQKTIDDLRLIIL